MKFSQTNQSFDLKFKELQLVNGKDGKSAYEIALENGFTGTEEEWLASLKGQPGETDYPKLTNLPQINGVELVGNKTSAELGIEGGTDISLGLTSASVGQIIKVKAVDENGKPTEWEAADMESGKAVYNETTLTEAVSSVEFSLNGADEFSIALKVPIAENSMVYVYALINGKQSGFAALNIGDTQGERFSIFTVKKVGRGIWFIRIKKGNGDIYGGSFNSSSDIPTLNGGILLDIETFGIKCYSTQQLPVGTTIYTIGGGATL